MLKATVLLLLLGRPYLVSAGAAKQPPAPAPAAGGHAPGAPVPHMLDHTDWQPKVEIRLSPPRHPLPEVSGRIETLDHARLVAEERQTTKLLKAYTEELSRSRKLITARIRRAFEAFDDPAVIPPKPTMSFFEIGDMRERPGRIWVSVEAPVPIDGAVINRIESIEKKNMKAEFLTFQSAIEDMSEVTRMTLQQLNESLINIMRPVINTTDNTVPVNRTVPAFIDLTPAVERCQELQYKFGTEFLPSCDMGNMSASAKSPHEHQISVFADEHLYPTVESLVQDMLKRREVDEELFWARSLALMARLAQEESKIAQDLLQSAVASITVQYSKVIRATNMTLEELKQYEKDHPKRRGKTFRKAR
jgi:hypothetical protein